MSTKITLVTVEPVEQLLVWSNVSGAIYKKTVSNYVIGLTEDGSSLTEVSTSSLNAGEWFFDHEAGEIYVRTSDDSNPNTKLLIVTYRQFFADVPITLPHDLTSSGNDVYYEGRLSRQSDITFSLDEEQVGIALESSTSISLENSDGHFDDFIDKLIFENKTVRVYSWSPSIPLADKRLLFRGIIENKSISSSSVSFNCKDEFFKLREPVNLERFTSSDGTIPDSFLDTPKRRIYGQVKQVKCVPVDAVLDGYELTGTVSVGVGSTTLTGVGTSFLDEVSPADILVYQGEFEVTKIGVESVDSDTQITLSDEIEITILPLSTIKCLPNRPFRKKNRSWHIAGHKLREPSTTVSASTQPNRFSVVSGNDIFPSDIISVDGEYGIVKRINSNQVVLESNLGGGIPTIGDAVVKSPVNQAFAGQAELIIERDWTVTNGVSDAILVIDPLAEFNTAQRKSMSGSLTFTQFSRTVTASGVDLRNEVETRDWVRSSDVTHAVWYEVLEVQESQLILRTEYQGNFTLGGAFKKNVTVLSDDAVVTVSCSGLQTGLALWVKTASDAVEHLLRNDVGTTDINDTSFDTAKEEMPYTLSYIVPKNIGDDAPTIKSVISEINQSVFGSLSFDTDFNYKYQVVSTERPSGIETITDDDIVGEYSVSTKNNIVRKVNSKYRRFFDFFENQETSEFYEYVSEFVDNFVGAKSELNLDLYLFDELETENITQRYALHNSLSQSIVRINGKLNLALKGLGDKVILKLDRLYKRFGSNDRQKVVTVNSIRRNGNNATLELTDLGNAFNRVPAITENTANDFTSALDNEKILNGYIVDNDLEVPDTTSDVELFSQLIG